MAQSKRLDRKAYAFSYYVNDKFKIFPAGIYEGLKVIEQAGVSMNLDVELGRALTQDGLMVAFSTNEVDAVTIPNNASGVTRYDLVVLEAQYFDVTGVPLPATPAATFKVLQGTTVPAEAYQIPLAIVTVINGAVDINTADIQNFERVTLRAIESDVQAFEQGTVKNLYVDAATGSDANNGLVPTEAFKTIGAAMAAIKKLSLEGYIAVNVQAGTYNDPNDCDIRVPTVGPISVDSGNSKVRFWAIGGQVIIDGSGVSGYGFHLPSAHVRFDGSWKIINMVNCGISLSKFASVEIFGDIECSSNGYYGISVTYHSYIHILANSTITCNDNGLYGIMIQENAGIIVGNNPCTFTCGTVGHGNGSGGIAVLYDGLFLGGEIVASGNTGHGITILLSSALQSGNITASNNSTNGVAVGESSCFKCTTLTCNSNTGAGVYVYYNSACTTGDITTNTNTSNGIRISESLLTGGAITSDNNGGSGLAGSHGTALHVNVKSIQGNSDWGFWLASGTTGEMAVSTTSGVCQINSNYAGIYMYDGSSLRIFGEDKVLQVNNNTPGQGIAVMRGSSLTLLSGAGSTHSYVLQVKNNAQEGIYIGNGSSFYAQIAHDRVVAAVSYDSEISSNVGAGVMAADNSTIEMLGYTGATAGKFLIQNNGGYDLNIYGSQAEIQHVDFDNVADTNLIRAYYSPRVEIRDADMDYPISAYLIRLVNSTFIGRNIAIAQPGAGTNRFDMSALSYANVDGTVDPGTDNLAVDHFCLVATV